MSRFPHNQVAGLWFLFFMGSYLVGCFVRREWPSEAGVAVVFACSLLFYVTAFIGGSRSNTHSL